MNSNICITNIICTTIIVLSITYIEPVSAEIYKWTDKNGHIQFSDRPPPEKNPIKITKNNPTTDNPNTPVSGSTNQSQQEIEKIKNQGSSIKLAIRDLLEQKKFASLNELLLSFQISFEKDASVERDLYVAYKAFRANNPDYATLFNEWIEFSPDSYQPYLARAMYLYNLGWLSRGTKWASETKKEQYEKMAIYFEKALKDIAIVMGIDNNILVPYYLTIGMASARGLVDEKHAAVQKALDINPATLRVRILYLEDISPRWGGSFQEMEAFVSESIEHASINPKLKTLPAYIYLEAGKIYRSSGQYSVAKEKYTKALEYGEIDEVYYNRGRNSYLMKEYQEAINDLDQAIALYTEDSDYYYWRGKAYGKSDQYTRAMDDFVIANKLKPNDHKIQEMLEWLSAKLVKEGYNLNSKHQIETAIERYNSALVIDSENADIYYRRARAYIRQNQNNLALEDMINAIELDPNNINYYLLIDWLFAKKKEWDKIIGYWDKYISLDPKDSRAYVERGGAYFHKGDLSSAVRDAKTAADMGNQEGKEAYEKFKHSIQ